MFSTLPTSVRAALVAALVGGSAVAVPTIAPAQSVTPERALLNRLDAVVGGPVTASRERASVDGERALLNRSRAVEYATADKAEATQPIVLNAPYTQGVQALLNRSTL